MEGSGSGDTGQDYEEEPEDGGTEGSGEEQGVLYELSKITLFWLG